MRHMRYTPPPLDIDIHLGCCPRYKFIYSGYISAYLSIHFVFFFNRENYEQEGGGYLDLAKKWRGEHILPNFRSGGAQIWL